MTSKWFKIVAASLLAAALSTFLQASDLNIKGNVNVQGDGSDTVPGDLMINGALKAQKYYKTYVADSSNPSVALGAWDFCSISMIYLEGNGNRCTVYLQHKGRQSRGNWTLFINQGLNGSKVICSATCLSFDLNLTGE